MKRALSSKKWIPWVLAAGTISGCMGENRPQRCSDQGCGVEGRLYYNYRNADEKLVNQPLILKSKSSGKEIGKTQTDSYGFFRFSDLIEGDVYPVGEEDGPPAIIVCDGSGNCFDYGPLSPMGCDLAPMPEAPDPPLSLCGAIVIDNNNGSGTSASVLDAEGVLTFSSQYGVIAMSDAELTFSGDFNLTSGSHDSTLSSTAVQLVQAGMKRVVTQAKVILGKEGDRECGAGKACFTFNAVPPGKYTLQLNGPNGIIPLADHVVSLDLKSSIKDGAQIKISGPKSAASDDGIVIEAVELR